MIFEAKTLSETNELAQSRAGLAQLLEYRVLLGNSDDGICLIVDRSLGSARAELLEALSVPVLALQVRRFTANNPCAESLSVLLDG